MTTPYKAWPEEVMTIARLIEPALMARYEGLLAQDPGYDRQLISHHMAYAHCTTPALRHLYLMQPHEMGAELASCMERALAVQKALKPPGWKMVPVEPTHEMLVSAVDLLKPVMDGEYVLRVCEIYGSLLEHAPDPVEFSENRRA